MNFPYFGGRKGFEDASNLIEAFGSNAGYEASVRADRSRDMGNHIHFCHWRQIERLIVLMSIEQPVGTVH
ncbi:MAG: hypothetical protein EP321_07595 [Sphingomonadales bacterium]|nr:MAG: hypothetical protein EP345_13550 [Sphingomonadales bacterium]TNF04329.1 MAG: hypothetical protein EP321_07595 [Sphingomonadales bacterium]